jgi:hypothetical protein
MVFQNSFGNRLVDGLRIDFSNSATGDIYYRNSAGELTRLGIGSEGQVLISGELTPFWGDNIAGGDAGGDFTGSSFPNPVLANDVVTFPKIQNISTGTFLGRIDAGSGNVEALTASQVRTGLQLGTAALVNTGSSAGDIPLLGVGGVIPAYMLPSIAITEVQWVANQTARLALDINIGSVAKQTDNGIAYMLASLPASDNANWISIGDTSIDAGEIVSGIIDPTRLGSGTANSTTVLFGDGTYKTINFIFPWTKVTGTSQTISVNNGYVINNASLCTLPLPSTSAIGDVIKLMGEGIGGWRISQNTGQSIRVGNLVSTTGTSGKIESYTSTPQATVELVCTATNTTWQALNYTGIINVVNT